MGPTASQIYPAVKGAGFVVTPAVKGAGSESTLPFSKGRRVSNQEHSLLSEGSWGEQSPSHLESEPRRRLHRAVVGNTLGVSQTHPAEEWEPTR